jgi:cell division protein FtsZ
VLDEQMGDEVKITVIATGFRDQMPERRARMLSIGEVVMAEEPVLSVPVVANSKWMSEPAVPVVAKANAPAPFMSEAEDDEMAAESDDATFFASSPASKTGHGSAAAKAPEVAPIPEPDFDDDFSSGFGHREPELVAAAARPQFAEMSEEPVYKPLPRDYAADFGSGTGEVASAEEHRAQPATALFPDSEEVAQRDLDTPTFLRRLRF